MEHLKRRIRKAEQQVRIEEDDEIITFDAGDGRVWQGTSSELRRAFREAQGTRHYPGIACRGDSQEDLGDTDQS